MKYLLAIASIVILFAACNNAENKNSDHSGPHDQPQTHEDSLLKDVMDGHDFTMAKMNRVAARQKQVQVAIDSINKMPEKLKQNNAAYKSQLDSLAEQLKYADYSMNKWMEEFNYDTATKAENRAVYLESEKKKIAAVKDAMLSSLQKADSLFKK
jgi:hypothetical protein